MVALGFEDLPFHEAIGAEEHRLSGEVDRMSRDPHYFSRPFMRYSYLGRGRYIEQLERWFKHYPRERFLIIESESFYRSPAAVMKRIQDFPEIDPWLPANFRMYSSATSDDPAQAAEEIEAGLRKELEFFFAPHNQRLAELLDQEFSWVRT